jgi:iron complex outermembrane receptor protein
MSDLDAVAGALGLQAGSAAAILNNSVKPMWFDELYRTIQNNDSTVIELQFKSDDDDDLQWVGGMFLMTEDNYTRFDVEMPFLGPIIRPLHEVYLQPSRTTDSYALFGQLDYQTDVEGLNLTVGYRHTWDEKEDVGGATYKTYGYFDNANAYCNSAAGTAECFWFESYDFVGDTQLVSDAGGIFTFAPWSAYYQSDDLTSNMGISGSDDLSAFQVNAYNDYKAEWDQGTWKLGADYVASEDLFVYGSVSTGYKAGGFGDNVDRGDGVFINFPYEPEFNTTYELGFKSMHLDGDLKLLGNVFYSDYEDMQRTLFGFVGYRELDGQAIYTLMTKNVPQTTIQGVELEFDWTPYETGRVFGWVSLLETENGGAGNAEATQDGYLCLERTLVGVDPCAADGTIDLSGNHLTWSPEMSWNLQFEHNTYTKSGMRIQNVINVNYVGEMFFNESNYDVAPFHSGREELTTVNTSMVFINEAKSWGLELYVHNATDELIKTDAYPANAGFVKAMYAPPIAYGVRFQKDF